MKLPSRIAGWIVASLSMLVVLAGCVTVGPSTIDRDRFDYVSAISESWKRQTLLNLVKTRYRDAPVFMDVTSVINQYALEGQVEMGFDWSGENTQALGGKTIYTDRPTISYSPLMGADFARSLLRPLPIGSILLLIQNGYPIDKVLRICAQGINGLDNCSSGSMGKNADPEFYELLVLLRQLQVNDGMRMRAHIIDEKEAVVMFFSNTDDDPDIEKRKRVLHLMGLNPDVQEFRVVYGNLAENDMEIAILSRSMIRVMSEYASYIHVPEVDIAEGRVDAGKQDIGGAEAPFSPPIEVYSGESKPEDPFVAVSYRDHWFWIDDRDVHSKESFYFLMLMFSFSEEDDTGGGTPVFSIPTN